MNWCSSCSTVLANEQVINDGHRWRCGTPVVKRNLEQWFLRITDYAQELLDDLDNLPGWPERVKIMQRNWIGRSEGARLSFTEKTTGEKIETFTTRFDTIFGVTFLALAPEHPSSRKIIASLLKGTGFRLSCRSASPRAPLNVPPLAVKRKASSPASPR